MKIEKLKNFIVFEGLDGAGTSTQSKLLSDKITNSYHTFEPTDSKIGQLIRDVLQKKLNINHLTLAFLFSTDRAEHLYGHNGIIERCSNNQIVISDRYLFSSLAYQSLNSSFENVLDLNKIFPIPEVVFFLNTSISVCQDRIIKRGNNKEIFESDSLQKNILDNYLKAFKLYKKYGLKTIFLDGNLPIDVLLQEELNYLKSINISFK